MPPNELTQMKFDMKDMKNDIKNISDKQDATNEKVAEIHDDLKEFIESSKGEFAGKWTEKLILTVGGTVVLALVAALLRLIIK